MSPPMILQPASMNLPVLMFPFRISKLRLPKQRRALRGSSNAQKAKIDAKSTVQSLQERNLKLENEQSTKLEPRKERVYEKIHFWFVENQSRLFLESSANSDVANLICN